MKRLNLFKLFYSLICLPIFFISLFACSNIKYEETDNKDWKRYKKFYIKSHAETPEEVTAINGLIKFSDTYLAAKYSFEAAKTAKLTEEQMKAIKKMEEYAETEEEKEEIQKIKERFEIINGHQEDPVEEK